MKKTVSVTSSRGATVKLGAMFAKGLKPGDCVLLTGGLGSGKTTFVKGMAKGLGIKDEVLSPTFVLAREYPREPREKFVHMDLYRIDGEDFFRSGLDQYMNPETICAVEWAEKLRGAFPAGRMRRATVNIELIDGNRRRIEIER